MKIGELSMLNSTNVSIVKSENGSFLHLYDGDAEHIPDSIKHNYEIDFISTATVITDSLHETTIKSKLNVFAKDCTEAKQ